VKKPFDKYIAYEIFVQEPTFEIQFLNKVYSKLRKGRQPLSLREDFCGTGYFCSEWVKQSEKHTAVGIDLDLEPIESGRERHVKRLTERQKKRLKYLNADVTHAKIKADIVIAYNFSFWFFQERRELLRYFRSVRKSMKRDSLYVLDTMGGSEVVEVAREESKWRGMKYIWECERFNPITHRGYFSIHFKEKGERLRKRVFTYDWRYWTLPEVRDVLEEAGFRKTIVYWEGDNKRGGGDGIFRPQEKVEDCSTWIVYLVCIP